MLVEGPADATELVEALLDPRARPPLALLAYTQQLPVRTFLYPLATYSPEYQALAWAREQGAEVELIDLPSDVFLGLEVRRAACPLPGGDELEEGEEEDEGEGEGEAEAEAEDAACDVVSRAPSLYERFAARAGEPDYDTFWERRFEHSRARDSYRLAALELGRGLRALDEERPDGDHRGRWVEDLVREAYMRRRLREAVARGHAPERIAVVVGAYHAPVIDLERPALSDAELASLPRVETKLTLMPYSYLRLSSRAGYGAGNQAPAYFELVWQALAAGRLEALPAEYLSRVVRHLRESGTSRSTAEVIEGVQLARTLAALRDAHAPVLRDLQDAAVTCIGHGERSVVQESLARVEVGTAIGQVPPGVSQTSIQDDFARELERLRLTRYRKAVKEELGLDLREDRHASRAEAAFLDLERSFFLHRLQVLGVRFATRVDLGPQSATWKEHWQLQWTPEAEIELVEAVLLGETVELATAFAFARRLERCTSITEAAGIVREACECGLAGSMELARATLQRLAVESRAFVELARAAGELSRVVRYGDVRRFDTTPLLPLIQELFVQGSLSLLAAAGCDAGTAQQTYPAMDELNRVAIDHDRLVEEALWIQALQELSNADDVSPLLSGYACAVLLERGLIATPDLSREVSRRLSPGIDADLGAGWFEGLSQRNRYALLSRLALWEQLAGYVASLDDGQFTRALVFLRRAFGAFSPQEKRQIAENLAEVWGVSGDALSEVLEQPLSEAEQQSLEQLNELDFGDL